MSASRRALAALVLATGALFAGCSFIVDFDESKIPADPPASSGGASAGGAVASGGGGGATGGGGGAITGGSGGTHVGPDSSAGGTGGDGTGGDGTGGAITGGEGGTGGTGPTPPACDVATNDGCADDELCCEIGQTATCKKTSVAECEGCGVRCPAVLSVACLARRCECAPGSGAVCSGEATERFCVTGPPASCAECRDATDCAGRTDGKSRCVTGKCALCDPAQNNAGCAGNEPICDAATLTCKACTAKPDDCPGALVCTASGACGGCATSAHCVTPTLPICEPTTTQCRICSSNAECVAQTGRPYCAGATCSPCTPAGDAGCTDPTKPDCRGAPGGGYVCQGCNASSCVGRVGTPVCDADTGRCVACADDNDCSGNPKAPFCVKNACVSCEAVSTVLAIADLRCALKSGGEPACIRTGAQKGECGACDPGGSRGCTQNQLCCDGSGTAACITNSLLQCTACTGGACNPLLATSCSNRGCRCGTGAACSGTGGSQFCVGGTCRECRSDADCSTAPEPLCEGNVCVRCDQAASANARCAADVPGTVCAAAGTFAGRCTACDPLTHAGCGTGTLNQCNPATSTCVDCVDDGGCSGTLDQCNVATRTCVDCMDANGCSGALGQCNVAAHACVDCTDDSGCSGMLGQCNVAAHACVDCMNDSGCSGTLDQCNVTAHACVDCDATGGCNAPTLPICDANACRGCQTDGECALRSLGTAPLCAASGGCAPDSPCTSNAGCLDANHPICAGLGADGGGGAGVCRRCDPVTGAGCGPTQTCTAQFVCTP